MAAEAGERYFQLGPDTLKVPVSLHAENRARLFDSMSATAQPGSFVLLEGGKTQYRNDTDHELLFRQESYFHWTFGVREQDFAGALDVTNRRAVLFCPRLPAEYAVWMGEIMSPSFFAEAYGVDECRYVDEIPAFFAEKNPSVIYTLSGKNTDSGSTSEPAKVEGVDAGKFDSKFLFPHMQELRVIKTEAELRVLRYIAEVTSNAHMAVMRAVRPGMTEYQMESLFRHEIYHNGGSRNVSYTCICAAGTHGATLHYGHAGAPNDKVIQNGEMCLFDMGGEYYCYDADITCSFPSNGKFTADQRVIYETVLRAVNEVENQMKPGVAWADMHRLANTVIVEELLKHGILHNGTVDEMMAAHVGALFMPHGLGHLLGLDTHDVGGYPEGTERMKEPGFKSLRTLRPLEKNMVITVEPGCYFIDALLDKALKDPVQGRFLNEPVLARFRKFGGVRIEDDVAVTGTGVENLTKVPRTVEEIEAWMASGRS